MPKHNFYNNAHPKSIEANADLKTKRLIKKKRLEARADEIAMESWARAGFLSAGLIDRRRDLMPDDLFSGA